MSDRSDHTVPRVPRTILLARLMWRCGFCIFAVVVGDAVLMAVPQAREALQATLAPRGGLALHWHQSGFVVAFVYWAVSAWLVARLLLSRRFPNDSLGVARADAYANWVAAVLPRVLAFLALLPVTLLVWQINRVLGLLTGLCALVILGALVLRSRFGDVTEGNGYGSFDFMGPMSRQAIWALMALSATLLAGLWNRPAGLIVAALWLLGAVALRAWDSRRTWTVADPEQGQDLRDEASRGWRVFALSLAAALGMAVLLVLAGDEVGLARALASPALLLFALGSWTLFGGFVLTYLPLTRRWIGLATWLPLLLFVAFSARETHFVAQRDLDSVVRAVDVFDAQDKRPTASQRFARWIAQVPAGDPVYMVAAVGGASRAAYWTGSVLAGMEDEARREERRFAANMFAISSISGGSLGATAFVAGVAQYPDAQSCKQPPRPPIDPFPLDGCLSARLDDFLKRDFLAPVFGRMLFPDLFIRFVPVPQSLAARADRSLGLEEAWAGDWRQYSGAGEGVVDWEAPIAALYQRTERADGPRLPLLLLNTVRLEDGQRFMQSVVRPDWPGTLDLLDPLLDTRRLTLAQAVHNSARFPYVSPGAMVKGMPTPASDEPPLLGRLGDGGYHEGSGAATLADLLEKLVADGQLRAEPDGGGLWACRAGWTKDRCDVPSPVVALILDSTPSSFPDDHVRGLDGTPAEVRSGVTPGSMALPEALAPVFGGLSTRTQLSRLSQQRLSRLVGKDPAALIELRMPLWRTTADDAELAKDCRGRRAQPSMNWYLDDCSRARLARAARGSPGAAAQPATLAEQALVNNLGRLRERVMAPAAPASGSAR